MKRLLAHYRLALLVAAALVSATAITWAQNPHFVGRVTATLDSNTGNVTVNWKEAGLGDNQNIDYVLSAFATAAYHCVNNGGQCPNAANKQEVQGPVTATGTFASGKNGQITAGLTLSPPAVTPFCPSGQTETLTEVSYVDITITDTTNGVSATARPSSVAAVLFVCP